MQILPYNPKELAAEGCDRKSLSIRCFRRVALLHVRPELLLQDAEKSQTDLTQLSLLFFSRRQGGLFANRTQKIASIEDE